MLDDIFLIAILHPFTEHTIRKKYNTTEVQIMVNLGKRTAGAASWLKSKLRSQKSRGNQTGEEKENDRAKQKKKREGQTEEKREARKKKDRERRANRIEGQTEEEREARRKKDRERKAKAKEAKKKGDEGKLPSRR